MINQARSAMVVPSMATVCNPVADGAAIPTEVASAVSVFHTSGRGVAIVAGEYWDTVAYGAVETGVFESYVGAAPVASSSIVRGCGGVRGDPGWGHAA